MDHAQLSRLTWRAWMATALSALSLAASANLVTNGDFETGDFTAWTSIGDPAFNGVQCPGPDASVFQGSCSAFFGPVGTPGGIAQTLATTAGQSYLIEFAFRPDGSEPSSFEVDFAGVTLLALIDPAASPYVTYAFTASAAGAASTLSFRFRDDPGFLLLDAVQVNPAVVPEPASLVLAGLALAGLAATRRMPRHAVPQHCVRERRARRDELGDARRGP